MQDRSRQPAPIGPTVTPTTDTTPAASRSPVSPTPIPYRGSEAPPFMQPAYRRRRNVGRTYR